MEKDRFKDHYETLQVNPKADPDTIERVFRLLAKRYHPDNKKTGNAERFSEIAEAHAVVSDSERRAAYDARYEADKKEHWSLFFEAPAAGEDEDGRMRRWILSLLYTVRRQGYDDPGMGVFELENYFEVAEGQLDFHLWYLKEKGWIAPTESGKFAITIDGVDWIAYQDRLFRKDRLIEGGIEEENAPGASDYSGEAPLGSLRVVAGEKAVAGEG